jgi:hypothetical protein
VSLLIDPYRFVAAGGGAFPTVADADTTSGQIAGVSNVYTMNWPANIASGDLILVAHDLGDWNWDSSNTGGLTRLLRLEGSGHRPSAYLWGKVAAGTESGTFTITYDGSPASCYRCLRIPAAGWFGGTLSAPAANTANASDGLSADASSGTSTASDPPSRTPAWGAANTLWIAMSFGMDAATTYSAFPTDYSNTSQQHHGTFPNPDLATARRELNATTENPGAFTLAASERWRAVTVAIRPAA